MFKYMGASRDGEAIFLDFQKNDFNFLLKIVEDDSKNKALSISYWYRDTEWNLETVETIGVLTASPCDLIYSHH